jgi:hypothetical protein
MTNFAIQSGLAHVIHARLVKSPLRLHALHVHKERTKIRSDKQFARPARPDNTSPLRVRRPACGAVQALTSHPPRAQVVLAALLAAISHQQDKRAASVVLRAHANLQLGKLRASVVLQAITNLQLANRTAIRALQGNGKTLHSKAAVKLVRLACTVHRVQHNP